jgi:membrane associated rhomboid family serine protease
MIPLGDSVASRRFPLVNTILIAANLITFALETEAVRGGTPILAQFALVPASISHLDWRLPAAFAATLTTLLTSLFLHAGLLHITGNMLYLFVFGPAMETRLGHSRFFGFYLAAGIIACLATVAMAPESSVPVIGASGAIAGVLGGYFMLYPGGRIRTVLPGFALLRPVEIPAITYLLIWFGVQLLSGISSTPRGPLVGGIAWWAHVGGFLFGVASAPLLATQPVKPRRTRPVTKKRRKRAALAPRAPK